jgi:energy-coupling factor transport system permease protein
MRRRVGGLRRVLLPVLVDSLDRSVELAAAMDSRGYGRRGVAPVAVRRLTTCVLVGAVLALSLAAYGLFDSSGLPAGATWALLGTGGLGTGLGLWLAGRHTVRTRYRPERWTAAAWGVAGCGAVCTAAFAWYSAVQPALMHPAPPPGEWPSTTPLLVAATVAAAAAALISPTPVTASDAA